ncbi:MAG: transporter substrate-binding domain-containing protein [Acidimicrobiales bacterium]
MRLRPGAAAAAAVLLVFAGCSASDNGGTIGGGAVSQVRIGPPGALRQYLPTAVAARGTLRVGAAIGRAPLLFYATGTVTPLGIDQDIMQAIGRQLGVTVTLANLPLEKLGPAVLAHQIDVFTSGFVDIKAFEGAGIDFVDDMTGRSEVLVRAANPAKVGGPDDLCGRTVAVVAGTAQQVAVLHLNATCASRKRHDVVFRGSADHAAALADLTAGRVDAVLDDSVVANYTAQISTGAATVEVKGAAVDPMPYGIGVARDQPEMRAAIHAALQAIISDGEYDAALAKWGGISSGLRTASINAGT